MKNILSLCINLLLLIISDAVPLKLIAGNRSVVKKDGATHTISKYYVVPNDYDSNNGTEETQKSLRKVNSKSEQSNESLISGNKGTDEHLDKKEDHYDSAVNFDAKLYDAKVDNEDGNNTTETKESVIATRRLEPDDLGNLLVKPINNSYKINLNITAKESNVGYHTSEGLRNGNFSILGTVVQETYARNLDSFWKLIKIYIDKTSDKDELLAKIERLSLLLNIFTFLYEDALLKKPCESMIDSIIDILQIPFVAKSKNNGDESKTNVFGGYSEQCLRTCDKNRTKPQLDSNGTYLSEAGGREANDNLELENLDSQSRQQKSKDDWVNTPSDPDSNQVTVRNKPIKNQQSELIIPINSNEHLPTLNDDDNENLDDPESNQTSIDSEKTSRKIGDVLSSIKPKVGDDSEYIEDEATDNLSWHIEDEATDNLSWHIEDKTDDNLPWHIEDKTDDNLPWHIEDKTDDNLPWHIEDKTDDNLPWHIEDKTDDIPSRQTEDRRNDNLPWHIEDRTNDDLPWHIEDRTDDDLPWHIEDRINSPFVTKITHKPLTVYKSSSHSLTKNGGKILLHPSQTHLTSSIHTVDVQNGIKKPYHIYVINPETSVHEVQNSKVKHIPPNINLATISGNAYKLPTSHSGIKVVNSNKPSSSLTSQFGLSNQPSNPHLKYTNIVSTTYDISKKRNPSDLPFGISQDDPTNQPKHFVNHGTEIFSTEAQTKSHTDHKTPRVLFPNVPINPFDSLLSNEPVSITASAIADTSDEIPDFLNQLIKPNYFDSNINLNHKHQPNLHEDLISKDVKYTKYKEIEKDFNKPTSVYEKETKISKVHHYPEYTKVVDNYDEPKLVYDVKTEPQRHLIAQITSQSESTDISNDQISDYINVTPDYGHTDQQTHSISKVLHYPKYTEVDKEYDKSISVYGGKPDDQPLYISKAKSEYTNIASDYNNVTPDYGYTVTDLQQPRVISNVLHYPEYTEVENKYDKTTSVHGGEQGEQSHYISKTKSEYNNIPSDYNNVKPDYVYTDLQQKPLISNVLYYPEHTEIDNKYDKTTSIYGGEKDEPSHYISKTKSEYTNIPSDYNNVTPDYGYTNLPQKPLISNVLYYPEHIEIEKKYDKPTSIHVGEQGEQSHYISKTKSEYTNIPSDYNNVTPDYGYTDLQQKPLISTVLYYPEHTEIDKKYDKPISIHGGEQGEQSHYISKTKSEYTNIPSDYNSDNDIDPYLNLVPYIPNNSGYKEVEKDSKHVHIIKPSHITHLVQRPAKLNSLKLKLAPSYRLFTVDNLLKLLNGITKTIEINGPDLDNDIALINLKKIVNIIVVLAEHLGETAGSNKWYEKIFYITKDNRHPLQLYAYNLLRQRWLHDLMLLLYKNNFNLSILQNPGIFSFLGSWKFPKYVLDFLDAGELIENNFYEPNGFDDTSFDKFSTHTYDDIFAKVPDDLENYITHNVINSYKSLDDVLGIVGLNAEPDAKKVTQILQKYLLHKSFIEKQENVIIRDNKVVMLKHVILFLKQKGYDALTISDLIRKLYAAVYSTEGKGCQMNHTNFAKNMYDVILPVLRRSGQ